MVKVNNTKVAIKFMILKDHNNVKKNFLLEINKEEVPNEPHKGADLKGGFWDVQDEKLSVSGVESEEHGENCN